LGHSAIINCRLVGRGLGLLGAGSLALLLGGCGGIEFQGKLFDYAGLSGTGQKEDVRMTERAPLLVPPNVKVLPPPGSPPITRADWPNDTDRVNKQIVAQKQAATAKQEAAADPTSPYAGKPKLIDKLLGRKKPAEDTVDLPEPDPSDKTAQDRARERAVASAPQKPVDQSLNAPTTPVEDDPFHPQAPDSYKSMSAPAGNNANY
jgi:hypothetical protein